MDRLREILSAASFLSANISSIDAQRLSSDHRKELQLAFDGLKRTLQPRISCETSSPNKCLQSSEIVLSALSCRQQQERPTTSLTETSQEASDTHSVQALITSPPSAVARFMEKLQNHSEEIHRFASANAKLPDLQNDDWTTEKDPRMVYIAISGRNATPLQRFQGWLSRYSCAQDYRTWAAEHKYAPSDLLNLSLKDADNRRAGHVAEYLSFIGRQDDRGFREAIQYGLKCMSFEGIYNDPGVCAVICLMFTSFRDLPYKYLNSLAQEIRKSQEWSTFIQGKAKWLSDCQAWLRDCCGRYQERHCSRKRPLEFGEQSQSKRLQPALLAQGIGSDSLGSPVHTRLEPYSGEVPLQDSSPRIYDPLEWDFRFLLEQADVLV